MGLFIGTELDLSSFIEHVYSLLQKPRAILAVAIKKQGTIPHELSPLCHETNIKKKYFDYSHMVAKKLSTYQNTLKNPP